jgi:AraC-like DNA-binding protein
MDVLSQILSVVKMEAARFFEAEYRAPWRERSPAPRDHGLPLAPGDGHLIAFHLLTEGRALARLEHGEPVALGPGDIVVLPHGDAHVLEHAGGAGTTTRFVCGYLSCDPRLVRTVLGGLPPLFKVSVGHTPAARWLESTIRFAVDHAGTALAGSQAVLAKLSEALFVETLRHYVALVPEEQTGWLAGARDPEVGRALALLHRQPARPWTVGALAKEAGVCRSVLTERFTRYLGEPPMAYLMRWRLQLGAQMLSSSRDGVAQVAFEVGYESESAFNRAFKREFGMPPGRFRERSLDPRPRRAAAAAR